MQISDIKEGVEVLFRAGKIVEYNGDVARYGEVAHHYEGGACWQTGWIPGTLKVVCHTKDLPKGFRNQTRFWRKGDIGFVGIMAPTGDANGAAPEFRMDDIEPSSNDANQPTGALQAMTESYIWEFRLPDDTILSTPSDSTYPPPIRPSPL